MQLDTDEGEMFVPPAGIVASSDAAQTSGHDSATDQNTTEEEGNEGVSG